MGASPAIGPDVDDVVSEIGSGAGAGEGAGSKTSDLGDFVGFVGLIPPTPAIASDANRKLDPSTTAGFDRMRREKNVASLAII
jgi:hypothetical protein